jgi:hypothetical protein
MQWYIHFQGKKEGPFSPDEFRQRIAALGDRDQVFVWRTGMDGWKKIQDVPELTALLDAHVPAAATKSAAQQDLSVLMEMPNLVDEKTSTIETKNLKSLRKEVKQAEKVASKARAQAKGVVVEQPPRMSGDDDEGLSLTRKLGYAFVLLAFVGGGALFYLHGAKPHFTPIADLTPADFQKLEATAALPSEQGAHVEFALSTSDVVHPKFYLASNQKDIHLAVTFEPVFGTFLHQTPQPLTEAASEMKNFVATTDRIEIPEGEYIVKVAEASQPQKVLAQSKFFLGGVKDAAYTTGLTQLHAQRKAQAESELRDLNETSAQLDAFLEIIQEVKRDPKTFAANQVKWEDLEKGFASHSILLRPGVSEETVVLSSLFKEGREVWKQFKALNELQRSQAAPGANEAQISSQIEPAFTSALAAVTAFKASLLKTSPAEIQ